MKFNYRATQAKILQILFNFIFWILTLDFGANFFYGKTLLPWQFFLLIIATTLLSWYLISRTSLADEIALNPLAFLPILAVRNITPNTGAKAYRAKVTFPRNVYQEESIILSAEISFTDDRDFSEHILPLPLDEQSVIDVELQAPAFAFSEAKKEGIEVPSTGHPKSITWNVLPTLSGKQLLLVKFVSQRDRAELLQLTETIRVTKIDGLTSNQVWVLATLIAMLAGVASIGKVIKDWFF